MKQYLMKTVPDNIRRSGFDQPVRREESVQSVRQSGLYTGERKKQVAGGRGDDDSRSLQRHDNINPRGESSLFSPLSQEPPSPNRKIHVLPTCF